MSALDDAIANLEAALVTASAASASSSVSGSIDGATVSESSGDSVETITKNLDALYKLRAKRSPTEVVSRLVL